MTIERMAPLAPRVSKALADYHRTNRVAPFAALDEGRVAVRVVADWLDELGHLRGKSRANWLEKFIAQAMMRAVASILRDEAKR